MIPPTDPAHLVGVGGAIGAALRYVLGRAIGDDSFPTGTLAVNVIGSFVLGFVTAAAPGDGIALLVATGACGSFTTFSSFSFETVRLWETGHPWRAVASAAGNLVLSVAALSAGWILASAVPVP